MVTLSAIIFCLRQSVRRFLNLWKIFQTKTTLTCFIAKGINQGPSFDVLFFFFPPHDTKAKVKTSSC